MSLSSRLHCRRRYGGQPLLPPLQLSPSSLLHSLVSLARDILDSQERHRSPAQELHRSPAQKRNLASISRRVRVLLAFLEEARELPAAIPPSALLCFGELHVVFQGIKLLSDECLECSRISLLMEHRRLAEFFHRLTLEMATALEILPLESLDVPSDVREQVDLVKQQAKRAKIYVDADESRVYTEVRQAMAQIERKEAPDASSIISIFRSLDLRSAEDCQAEIEKLEGEEEELWWDMAEHGRRLEDRRAFLCDLTSFVRYCKCVLYGASKSSPFEPALQELAIFNASDLEEAEMKVPDEFLCPIALELMKDPVIVSTGQTYERSEIARWIASGNRTCPTSGVRLAHTTLTPNYALRNLIRLWCIQNNVHISAPRDCSTLNAGAAALSTPATIEATKLTVELLLAQLACASSDSQRHIAGELRLLAKCNSDNRRVIADLGGIPLLINLLSSPDTRTQEHSVTAILNVSIYSPNKLLILSSGGLDLLVQLLRTGRSETVRENAAAALLSLSQVEEASTELGRKADAIDGLLQICRDGSARGRRDAGSALFNMAMCAANQEALVKAGIIEFFVSKMASRTEREGMVEEAMSLLAVLAGNREARDAILAMDAALPMLGEALRTGGQKERENAAAILLCLCRQEEDHGVIARVQTLSGLHASLYELLGSGSSRARRKASSLLRILHT